MRIYKYGNDYAFQNKSKNEQKAQSVVNNKPGTNAGDTIQNGGERAVDEQKGADATEVPSPDKEEEETASKKRKKKD